MALTPEQEAAYALDYDLARDGLKPDVQLEYDRQREARRHQRRPAGPDASFRRWASRCAGNPSSPLPRRSGRQHSGRWLVLRPG